MIAAALAAAAAVMSGSFEAAAAEDAEPALAALGPQPAGATAVTVWAGTPFHGARVDHGFGERVDVGLGIDVRPALVVRPSLQVRVRAMRTGPWQLGVRGTLARALTSSAALVPTTDGELALQLGYALVPRLAAFAEGSLLGTTDFTREHSAAFAQAQVGVSFAPPGPFSLLGSLGVMRGARGSRAVGTGGVAVRF
jgi:hypothetical protein